MAVATAPIRTGTAGWSIPKAHAHAFPSAGSHLERYGAVLNAVEINSSFYRPHRRSTYERWADAVPAGFRFAVKMPKAITHEQRLAGADALLDQFLFEVTRLGGGLGPVLVHLPPKLSFQSGVSDPFLRRLRDRFTGEVACEPRHASWFTPEVEALLSELQIARVAADPAPVSGAGDPGGWHGLLYYRLHGSPRMYYSPYGPETLSAITARLLDDQTQGRVVWCIFDNTAEFAATRDALVVRTKVQADLSISPCRKLTLGHSCDDLAGRERSSTRAPKIPFTKSAKQGQQT